MARYSIQVRGNEIASSDVLADALATAAKTPVNQHRPFPGRKVDVTAAMVTVVDTTTGKVVSPSTVQSAKPAAPVRSAKP